MKLQSDPLTAPPQAAGAASVKGLGSASALASGIGLGAARAVRATSNWLVVSSLRSSYAPMSAGKWVLTSQGGGESDDADHFDGLGCFLREEMFDVGFYAVERECDAVMKKDH